MSRTASAVLKHNSDELLQWVSCHTRQLSELEGREFEIDTRNWQEVAEAHNKTGVGQMLDKLMRWGALRTPVPGTPFRFNHSLDYPLVDAAAPETAWFLICHAMARGLLTDTGSAPQTDYTITFDGWEYIERTGLSSQSPARVFVAMSFDDSMDDTYRLGIQPAVESDCGFVCVNLKHLHHGDDITDRMLAEIRRCQILVADFTQQKHGVYFEAGFALALGKHVVWCVRKDEMGQVHFDTNHRPHITWADAPDLREKLRDRLQALFPEAIRANLSDSKRLRGE